jgi:phage repressor protein C with HTH and peptisase S24 domain
MKGADLQPIMDALSFTQVQLAEAIEVRQSTISTAASKKDKELSYQLERKLLDYMEQSGIDIKNILSKIDTFDKKDQKVQSVPYYDVDVFASDAPLMEEIGAIEPSYFIPIPFFRDCDFAVKVSGHSMYPKIASGDIIVVKEIRSREFLVYGEIYLIVSKTDNYRVIKYLHEDPENEQNFLLVSENGKVKPFSMPKTELYKLYLVKGRVDQLCL